MTKVDWHPYPEEKSALRTDGYYMVTYRWITGDFVVDTACWDGERWENFPVFPMVKVIAWAELPEPYQPENKDE